jgi:hypothetical protein
VGFVVVNVLTIAAGVAKLGASVDVVLPALRLKERLPVPGAVRS